MLRMQLVNKDKLYRVGGLVAIVFITIWVLLQGASVSTTNNVLRNSNLTYLKTSTNSLWGSDGFKYQRIKSEPYDGPKEKATFVTLARNSDLYSLISSITGIEDRFNKHFQYNWVFLNDEEFTEEFKRVTSALVSGETEYGLIPKEHWSFPEWIDLDKAAKVRKEMAEKQIIYGDSVSYRHMCRYESGFFYRHPLLDKYDWYWRVEPDVKFYCDIDYDVFKFMKDNNKKYGFSISIKEYIGTIETLWDTTKQFINKHPEHIHPNNMLDFISDDHGDSYNLCHFWSNFEIASLDLWRGDAYSAYFDHLDKAGGFFYERWGDAPVHSIAAALLLDRTEIHHFADIGYYHNPFYSCPIDDKFRLEHRCACDPSEDFTWNGYSCTSKYYTINNLRKPKGWMDHTQ